MPNKNIGLNVIVAVLIVIGAIGGLLLFNKSGGITAALPLIGQKVTESTFDFIEDPLIRKHFAAQANQRSYRTKSTSTGPLVGNEISFSEIEIKGDDFSMYQWQETAGNKKSELILMGDTTYVKDYADNTWWKQVAKDEPLASATDEVEDLKPKDYSDAADFAKNYTYEKLGEETCPNEPNLTCYKYRETQSNNPDGSRTFWFDKQKFLLRKEESGFGEYKVATEYSYIGVSVKTPSPTKDVPEGRNIYEYLSTGTGASLEFTVPPNVPNLDDLNLPENFNLPDANSGNDYGDYDTSNGL